MSAAETHIEEWLQLGNTDTTLYIQDDQFITTLPHIPETVQRLAIYNCERLALIPPLPTNLRHLQIDKCPLLETLPSIMPPRLFHCSIYVASRISRLPTFSDHLSHLFIDGASSLVRIDELPSSLEELYVRNTPIRHLPVSLPPNLRKLVIPDGDLYELPPLPDCLDTLHFQSAHMRFLPRLPLSLRTLNVSNMIHLHELPAMLPPHLTELYAKKTALTELPTLPSTLRVLFVDSTPIRELPPHLQSLCDISLAHTQIKSLPCLPQELFYLNIEDTPIKRLKAAQFINIDTPCVIKTHALSIEDFLSLPSNIRTIEFTNPDFHILDLPIHLYFTALGPFEKPPPIIKFKHNGTLVEIYPHPYSTPESLLELEEIVEEEMAKEKARVINRTRIVKEELMIKTWHPSRVEDWCGVRFDVMDD